MRTQQILFSAPRVITVQRLRQHLSTRKLIVQMDTMVSFQVLDHSMIASHALSVTTVIQTLFQFQMLIVKNQLESAKLEASAVRDSIPNLTPIFQPSYETLEGSYFSILLIEFFTGFDEVFSEFR